MRAVRDESMDEALDEEVRESVSDFEYKNWKRNKHKHLSKLPEVAVSFDIGW